MLTLDAFGTLFYPRQSIGRLYGEMARMHGLSGFTDQDVDVSFRKGKEKGIGFRKLYIGIREIIR